MRTFSDFKFLKKLYKRIRYVPRNSNKKDYVSLQGCYSCEKINMECHEVSKVLILVIAITK